MDKAIHQKETAKPEWFDAEKLVDCKRVPTEACQKANIPIPPSQEPTLYCPRCGNLCCPYESGDEYAA